MMEHTYFYLLCIYIFTQTWMSAHQDYIIVITPVSTARVLSAVLVSQASNCRAMVGRVQTSMNVQV